MFFRLPAPLVRASGRGGIRQPPRERCPEGWTGRSAPGPAPAARTAGRADRRTRTRRPRSAPVGPVRPRRRGAPRPVSRPAARCRPPDRTGDAGIAVSQDGFWPVPPGAGPGRGPRAPRRTARTRCRRACGGRGFRSSAAAPTPPRPGGTLTSWPAPTFTGVRAGRPRRRPVSSSRRAEPGRTRSRPAGSVPSPRSGGRRGRVRAGTCVAAGHGRPTEDDNGDRCSLCRMPGGAFHFDRGTRRTGGTRTA